MYVIINTNCAARHPSLASYVIINTANVFRLRLKSFMCLLKRCVARHPSLASYVIIHFLSGVK